MHTKIFQKEVELYKNLQRRVKKIIRWSLFLKHNSKIISKIGKKKKFKIEQI
jgi:hypothetical protein